MERCSNARLCAELAHSRTRPRSLDWVRLAVQGPSFAAAEIEKPVLEPRASRKVKKMTRWNDMPSLLRACVVRRSTKGKRTHVSAPSCRRIRPLIVALSPCPLWSKNTVGQKRDTNLWHRWMSNSRPPPSGNGATPPSVESPRLITNRLASSRSLQPCEPGWLIGWLAG